MDKQPLQTSNVTRNSRCLITDSLVLVRYCTAPRSAEGAALFPHCSAVVLPRFVERKMHAHELGSLQVWKAYEDNCYTNRYTEYCVHIRVGGTCRKAAGLAVLSVSPLPNSGQLLEPMSPDASYTWCSMRNRHADQRLFFDGNPLRRPAVSCRMYPKSNQLQLAGGRWRCDELPVFLRATRGNARPSAHLPLVGQIPSPPAAGRERLAPGSRAVALPPVPRNRVFHHR